MRLQLSDISPLSPTLRRPQRITLLSVHIAYMYLVHVRFPSLLSLLAFFGRSKWDGIGWGYIGKHTCSRGSGGFRFGTKHLIGLITATIPSCLEERFLRPRKDKSGRRGIEGSLQMVTTTAVSGTASVSFRLCANSLGIYMYIFSSTSLKWPISIYPSFSRNCAATPTRSISGKSRQTT